MGVEAAFCGSPYQSRGFWAIAGRLVPSQVEASWKLEGS